MGLIVVNGCNAESIVILKNRLRMDIDVDLLWDPDLLVMVIPVHIRLDIWGVARDDTPRDGL